MFREIRSAARVLKDEGIRELVRQSFFVLMAKYGQKLPAGRFRWNAGLRSEMDFWDSYFRTKGLQWADSYGMRFDPNLPLQPRPATLLPSSKEVHILDVGAGPMTYLGKTCEGKILHMTAVDALADQYDRILRKYRIEPLIRTQKLAAEKLTKRFHSDTFDLVYARNCMDHAYNPETAILQMVSVAKRGCYVLLEHLPNEAETEGYSGLHQWNFSMSSSGDFIISSKTRIVNMTQKHAGICCIVCEIIKEADGIDWLITKIHKK